MRKLLALGLSLAVLSAVACGRDAEEPGSVWQWVDAKGSVQFAESLDDVPEAYRGKAGKIPMSAKAMARKRSEPVSDVEPKVKKAATAATAPVGAVTLYVSSLFDNHTAPTIQALQDAGIAFETVDVEKDASAKEHLKKLTHRMWPERGDGYAAPMLEHEEAFFFGDGKEPVRELTVHLDWVRRGRPLETPSVFIDVESDGNAAGRVMDATGSVGVPVTIVNGQIIHGYSPTTAKEIAAASHRAPVQGGVGAFLSTLFGS